MNKYLSLMIRKNIFAWLISALFLIIMATGIFYLNIFLILGVFIIAGFMVLNYDITNQNWKKVKINKVLKILPIDTGKYCLVKVINALIWSGFSFAATMLYLWSASPYNAALTGINIELYAVVILCAFNSLWLVIFESVYKKPPLEIWYSFAYYNSLAALFLATYGRLDLPLGLIGTYLILGILLVIAGYAFYWFAKHENNNETITFSGPGRMGRVIQLRKYAINKKINKINWLPQAYFAYYLLFKNRSELWLFLPFLIILCIVIVIESDKERSMIKIAPISAKERKKTVYFQSIGSLMAWQIVLAFIIMVFDRDLMFSQALIMIGSLLVFSYTDGILVNFIYNRRDHFLSLFLGSIIFTAVLAGEMIVLVQTMNGTFDAVWSYPLPIAAVGLVVIASMAMFADINIKKKRV